jgi:hypothetical protein
VSFFFFFGGRFLEIGEIGAHGSGRNPGNVEPYIVPSQKSTYVNAVMDQNGGRFKVA